MHRIEQDESGVVAFATNADATEYSFNADYVIVACGAKAEQLRNHLGVSFEGRTFDDKFLICDIIASVDGWDKERRFYFDPEWNPGRQVLIHPCPDSQYRIDWQVPAEFDLEHDEKSGGLDHRIRQIIGDADYEIAWKSVYRFHSRVVDRMRVGRVLLAGDTAHLVSPFGGRGLNSGIGDAENAAWKLAFVLRGWADESLLNSYDDERRAAAIENIEVTSATMDFMAPQTDEQWETRQHYLEAAVTDPSVRANINSGRLFEPFWYVNSPLTTPNANRPFAGRPPKGETPDPGPGIILPDTTVRVDGLEQRIRRIAREGLMLLLGDDADATAVEAAARSAVAVPVDVFKISDLDTNGSLTERLRPTGKDVWIIRPDAYIAAVCGASDREALTAALRQSIGSRHEGVNARSDASVAKYNSSLSHTT